MNSSVRCPSLRIKSSAHMSRELLCSGMWRAIVCVLQLSLLTATAFGQQQPSLQTIGQPQWGFDNRVVVGHFMPLSILLDNLSSDPVEGELSLRLVTGMLREGGGTLVQPLFIDAQSRRWVTFYPYVSGITGSWRLTLKTTDGEVIELDEIEQGRSIFLNEQGNQSAGGVLMPAVILDPSGMATRSPTTIKHMPSEVFPPYSTATTALAVLFLDHVPDWETPRQSALLGWLKRGGRLHLLLDQNNQQLQFSGILAPLNEPFDEFEVESGIVYRHNFQREALSEQMVKTVTELQKRDITDPEELADIERATQYGMLFQTGAVDDNDLFDMLRERTQPDHAWWLLFLLSMAYVGLIFPGCWLLSKQPRLHFSATYGAIIGLATLFSLFFIAIGRRGYGETTVVHTLGVARAEDATNWHVFGYDNLFVIDGDRYRIEEKDHESLMAAEAGSDITDAQVTSGNIASFVTRIPPFSSQAVLSQRRLSLPDWQLHVKGIGQSNDVLTSLTIGFGSSFPADDPEPPKPLITREKQVADSFGQVQTPAPGFWHRVKCYAIYGRTVHDLQVNRTTNELTLSNVRMKVSQFSNPGDIRGQFSRSPFGGMGYEDIEDNPLEECYRRALPMLFRRMLLDSFIPRPAEFSVPDGRVRLLVYAPVPKAMELPTSVEAQRIGRLLFVRDLPLNSSLPAAPAE